ncbi:mannitol dehydrogenase family protein [Okibacterium endophyticum]
MAEPATPVRLSSAALPQLKQAPDLTVPAYDRAGLTTGIVHIGVGAFHRSHQAVVIDDLLAGGGGARDWAICGVGLREGSRRIRDALEAQDGLYTLVEKHPDGGRTARVIGSIVEFLYAPDDPDAVLERMASPETRIVSLTITEGGYNVDQVTGEFDLGADGIAGELTAETPTTVFGYLAEALRRRRDRGIGPFTVMSCDNLQHNGRIARTAVVTFATALDRELGDWIARNVLFPSSMVDRITPVTTDADRAELARQFGIDDAWPVVAEPFTQWVLEDSFTAGRPPFERAGVQVVDDVEPYEMMKLRMLNASHQAMAYVGHLLGYEYVHDAANDPVIARFLLEYMRREAAPTLRPVPGIDLERYPEQLVERFANPGVRDTIARLCADTSDRIPKFVGPVIRDALAGGGDVALSAAIVASWARYATGVDENGQPFEVVDRLRDELIARARQYPEHPYAFLDDERLFGRLIDDPRFVAEYDHALALMHEVGVRKTLETLLDELG